MFCFTRDKKSEPASNGSRRGDDRISRMSIFTNSIESAGEQAGDYIEAVLGLVGNSDPLEILARLAPEVERRAAGLTEEQLRQPEAPGKWSMLEVIGHLVDSEVVWAYRVRTVVAEDRPTLKGYDQDLWVQNLRYRGHRAPDLIADLGALRDCNLHFLHGLDSEERQRVGLHSERGEETVDHMLRLYAGHDLVHLAQLDRIRKAVE